jgi:predicted ATPase/transcriptional regulator with XRE-family HTH domain
MDLPIFFGEWLKRRRKVLDLTQAELGQRAGCSVFTLRKIESGERRPSKQLAGLLARALEIPPEQELTFIKVARGDLRTEHLGCDFNVTPKDILDRDKPAPARHNLPRLLTTFVGRCAELSAMDQLLNDPYCRILTLVGPGGIGKTRLAIEFASQQLDRFPDGVTFVPLAPLSSPFFLVPTIADAVGLVFQGRSQPRNQLLNFLSGKQTLLVLDNCEHLLDGVDLYVEMLECAPGLKLLVTSRELLNLKGEWVFEIQGLPVPTISEIARAEEFSAIALFLQSAKRVMAGFELLPEDRLWAVKICRKLEGMPLGIELAAAWVRVLSCREIYTEIEKNIDFLSAPARDLPERHHSMRAVFEHSWDMLNEKEQQALGKLSVFRGGFKREAAEHVTGADLPLLSMLLSKSLVRRTPSGRYDQHELLRQFAAHRLEENPTEEAYTRSRHSVYYLGWMREAQTALMSQHQHEVLAEMSAEVSNLRASWEWAIKNRQPALISETAWPIFYLHELRSLFHEGERIFTQAVRGFQADPAASEVERDTHASTLAYLEVFRGYLIARQGRVTEADQILRHNVEILAEQADPSHYAIALLFSGIVLRYTGELQKSSEYLRKAHELTFGTGQGWIHGASAVLIGVVEHDLRNLVDAQQWLEKGLFLCRTVGEPVLLAYAISSKAQTASALGCFAEVEPLLEEGLCISAEIGHYFTQALLLEQWARLCFAAGDPSRAIALGRESITMYREYNDRWHLSRALSMLGKFEQATGNVVRSSGYFIESVEIALQDHLYPDAFEALVEIIAGMDEDENGARVGGLVQYILQHPASAKEIKERAENLMGKISGQLSSDQLEQAISGFEQQSIETVVQEILRRERFKLDKSLPIVQHHP